MADRNRIESQENITQPRIRGRDHELMNPTATTCEGPTFHCEGPGYGARPDHHVLRRAVGMQSRHQCGMDAIAVSDAERRGQLQNNSGHRTSLCSKKMGSDAGRNIQIRDTKQMKKLALIAVLVDID
jgi:hypothetical protein